MNPPVQINRPAAAAIHSGRYVHGSDDRSPGVILVGALPAEVRVTTEAAGRFLASFRLGTYEEIEATLYGFAHVLIAGNVGIGPGLNKVIRRLRVLPLADHVREELVDDCINALVQALRGQRGPDDFEF